MDDKEAKLSSVQKAALLLLAVGQERAGNVLKNLEPKDVQQVGEAMAKLGAVSTSMVDGVLEQFIVNVKRQTGFSLNSDSYIRNMLVSALGEEKANSVIDKILMDGKSKGIAQLRWMDTRSIADMIRLEHPQIIATILSLMDPEQAATVMALLAESTRTDVVMRIANMETIQPAAIKELDAILMQQLSGGCVGKVSAVGGIDTTASILNYMETNLSEEMMAFISEYDEGLGQHIQNKMFVFSDLMNIDDQGIQVLLREVSTGQLLLALRGVEEDLKEKIFSNMSRRAADMLRDDLDAAPPTKLSEVELAQKEILVTAKKLADRNVIVLDSATDELV